MNLRMLHRSMLAGLATIGLSASTLAIPPGLASAHLAADGLPPLPSRAIIIAADISASVPLSLAESTRRLVVRSLDHAYARDALDQGVPDTLVEWIAIGIDSFSPRAVLARAWIPGAHARPGRGFLAQRLSKQINGIIDTEQAATRDGVRTVIRQLDGLHFRTQYGTDLEGAPLRAALDAGFVTGPTTLVLASDLLGAPPQSDGVSWHLPTTRAIVFEYCTQSTVDNPHSCQRRRALWDGAFHQAGATTTWYSATNLDTLPDVAFAPES